MGKADEKEGDHPAANGMATKGDEFSTLSENCTTMYYSCQGGFSPVLWRTQFEGVVSLLPDPTLQRQVTAAIDRILIRLADPSAVGLPIVTADDLLSTKFPEPTWAVPGILPVGLALLGGRPKVGKSWLALQIALAVASGGFALGQQVRQGRVLYLALEDSPQRLQSRMRQQHWPTGLPADFVPLGVLGMGALRNGGGERLAEQASQVGYRLIIVDTLTRAIGGDPNDLEAMSAALAPLQELAHREQCCVLILDHHRKPITSEWDVVSDLLGTTGKAATADVVLGLYRERGKPGARLAVTGRDVEERVLALRFDSALGCWQAEDESVQMTDKQGELVAILAELQPITVAELAEALNVNRGTIYNRLTDLERKGVVCKAGSKWVLAR